MPSLTDWEALIERKLAERGPVDTVELAKQQATATLIEALKHRPEWLEYTGAVLKLKADADEIKQNMAEQLADPGHGNDAILSIRTIWLVAKARSAAFKEALDLATELAKTPEAKA